MEKITLSEGLMAKMMESEAWKNISEYYSFSEVQLEKFADRLNWKNVVNNWSMRYIDVKAVLDKFEDRIPATEFKDSYLWVDMTEIVKQASAGGKLPVSVGKDAAEWLKGNGDMLMKSGRSIRRVQCATIPDGVNPCPYGDLTAYSAE